jgi:hypothetical protein
MKHNQYYMEVILSVLHRHVDKFAVLNLSTNEIHYTRAANRKIKHGMNSIECKRVFEDLYGPLDTQCVHKWQRTIKRLRQATTRR